MMHALGHGLQEHDAMRCRSCGNEERATEGAPCESCGTFLCIMCQFKGIKRCAACDGRPIQGKKSGETGAPISIPVQQADMREPADTASANAKSANEDTLIDYLFDQLTPPDDRPTP